MMQVVRKEDLCVVSLKNESKDEAWFASQNRLALVAQADNAARSEEVTIMLYIKLRSYVPSHVNTIHAHDHGDRSLLQYGRSQTKHCTAANIVPGLHPQQ